MSATEHSPEYYNNQQLQNVIKILGTPRLDAIMKPYYQMYSNRNYKYGGCAGLNGFITSDIDVTMKQNCVTGIKYSMVSSWKVYEEDAPDITSVSCDDITMAAQIIEALRANKNEYTDVTVTCADNRWIIRSCPIVGISSTQLVMNSPVLCVNCDDPCSKETQCRTKGPTLILAPCSGYTCENDYKAIDVVTVFFKPLIATPGISKFIVTPSRDSVTINGTLTDRGVVYCGVFKNESDVNVQALLTQGSSATSSLSLTFDLVLDSLIPSSKYTFFCMTLSMDGSVKMLMEDILKTATSFETLCCKQGTVINSSLYFFLIIIITIVFFISDRIDEV